LAAQNSVWRSFCAGLVEAGEDFLGPDYPDDPQGLVEGHQHLADLLGQALRWYLGTDPDFPRFISLNDTFELADNRLAPIRAGATYRLTGDASTLFDLNISLHEGWPFLGEAGVWGDIGLDDLKVNTDGTFELIISPERHDDNWLELPEGAQIVQIREYFADWGLHRPGTFKITRVGSEGGAPAPLDGAGLEDRLQQVIRWVRGYTPAHLGLIKSLRSGPPNVIGTPRRLGGGNSNIAYGFGVFDLEPDQALILTFDEPDARLWGVQWLTTPWYENPDVANRFTSVIGHEAHVSGDGRVRIVVSATDPGTPNWLEIADHREGVIAARFIWGQGDGPAITTSVVAAADVAGSLPPDTPSIDAATRAGLQARRRSHFAQRRR
jgi:hypothetical protein